MWPKTGRNVIENWPKIGRGHKSATGQETASDRPKNGHRYKMAENRTLTSSHSFTTWMLR
ncbi:hypothetical protein DPMN_116889 [Dreissena polymorpha]|uniref:Uncharacterized protein n=1 Tax=Dreissena polymorpha TaxID=45954 RepID=A0A9D4JD23_DREPO|nr:hypothetical protein DPMN_131698 [Dreissena polymorpha]KAH3843374.1 hypothetical protein DPMN_116889 [Dreissena polymorpha]